MLLFVSSVVSGQTPSATKPKPRAILTGHYVMRRAEFRNRLNMRQLPDRKIKFDLLALWVSHYNPENVHKGQLQGMVRAEKGVAVYEADNCKLRMEFLPTRVRIMQSDEVGDCGFGANVTATGFYRKIDGRKPKFDF